MGIPVNIPDRPLMAPDIRSIRHAADHGLVLRSALCVPVIYEEAFNDWTALATSSLASRSQIFLASPFTLPASPTFS